MEFPTISKELQFKLLMVKFSLVKTYSKLTDKALMANIFYLLNNKFRFNNLNKIIMLYKVNLLKLTNNLLITKVLLNIIIKILNNKFNNNNNSIKCKFLNNNL